MIDEDELALAERYAAALETIDELKGNLDEDDVNLAERYAESLKVIDGLK